MPRHLPIFDERCLDDIGVANPCDADWTAMKGDDRVRHCPSCRLNVYNLSAMTRREAAALITAREGRLCVRMLRRTDGTLITQDCRERLRAARRRGVWAFAVALAIVCITQLGLRVVGLGALLSWYHQRQDATTTMGDVASPRPPAPLPVMGDPAALPAGSPPQIEAEQKPSIPTAPPATRQHRAKKRRPAEPVHTMGKMTTQGGPIMGDYIF
jgi:hypothetical protein